MHRKSLPHLVRYLSQQAPQTARRTNLRTPSDYHYQSALRHSKVVHRQSSRWRAPNSVPSQQKPHPTPNPSAESRSARLLLSYHDLERALEARGLNTVRVVIFGASVTALGFGLAWPRIKKWGAVEGAEVAAASLETEQLQTKASAMLHEVLADPKTGVQVEALLKGAVLNLFEDEHFTDKAVQWTATVLREALTWDEVRQQGSAYVTSVLEDPDSQKSAHEYLSTAIRGVAEDEVVQDTVGKSLWSSVRASLIGRRKPRDAKAKTMESERPEGERAVANGSETTVDLFESNNRSSPGMNEHQNGERCPVESEDGMPRTKTRNTRVGQDSSKESVAGEGEKT